jgi:hypothetical protein
MACRVGPRYRIRLALQRRRKECSCLFPGEAVKKRIVAVEGIATLLRPSPRIRRVTGISLGSLRPDPKLQSLPTQNSHLLNTHRYQLTATSSGAPRRKSTPCQTGCPGFNESAPNQYPNTSGTKSLQRELKPGLMPSVSLGAEGLRAWRERRKPDWQGR